ncbi:hypothetical protein OH809_44580 (plasmid) [Streptomyces sp. NBC_00873]|uniref:hypothetical protein n=1 Tax=unclassified Streptomyces TaxID=2593676 RepID=UPI0038665F1E|nr:hypothetical protein OH809_44580 [Streptomyces sp. NBC_00873]WTA49261.1 hypothetical protein OH821_44060 [Streptomyces sp. NBC_00842]
MLGTSELVNVQVRWAGGHRTDAQVARPVACLTQLSYYPRLRARAAELVEAGCTTAQIAEHLNAEGFRPPKRCETFTRNAVNDLLRPWASSAHGSRTVTAPTWTNTSGGCATSPSTWACPRSRWMPGSGEAGPPATCTRRQA